MSEVLGWKGVLGAVGPWGVAKELHSSPDTARVSDKRLARLGLWRSIIGLAATIVVGVSYGATAQSTVVDSPAADLVVNASLAIIAMPLCVVGLYFLTKRGRRGTLNPGVRRMLRNLTVVIAMIIIPVVALSFIDRGVDGQTLLAGCTIIVVCGPLFGFGVVYLNNRESMPGHLRRLYLRSTVVVGVAATALFVESLRGVGKEQGVEYFLGLLVGAAAGIWWIVYFFFAFFWLARTVMWVGEVHPMLAPIGSALIVLLALANKVLGSMVFGHESAVPSDVWIVMAVVGVITALTLSVVEYRGLSGLGFRLMEGAERIPGRESPRYQEFGRSAF